MTRMMIILLPMALLSLSMAQQLPLGDNLDRWWFLAVPAGNLSTLCSNSNSTSNQPVNIRDDYTYTAGIGAHKVHKQSKSWHEARRICDLEGGHLVIINSVAEANLIVNQVLQLVPNMNWAHIGFHDLFVPGEYLTIHNQPLEKAGFSEWFPGEPTSGDLEGCGSISGTRTINDIDCQHRWPFVCEIPVQ